VLAPEHLDADDARGYCLDCTRKTGRLVRRTCPARDRARDAKRAASAAARQQRQERLRKRVLVRYTVAGLDVREVLRRCWTALGLTPKEQRVAESEALLKNQALSLRSPMPSIKLRHDSRSLCKSTVSYQLRMIYLTVPAQPTQAGVWYAVLRAVTMLDVGQAAGHPSLTPTETYNRALARAARRLWRIKLPVEAGYRPGQVLRKKLAEKLSGA
jgi:hypothetical protein